MVHPLRGTQSGHSGPTLPRAGSPLSLAWPGLTLVCQGESPLVLTSLECAFPGHMEQRILLKGKGSSGFMGLRRQCLRLVFVLSWERTIFSFASVFFKCSVGNRNHWFPTYLVPADPKKTTPSKVPSSAPCRERQEQAFTCLRVFPIIGFEQSKELNTCVICQMVVLQFQRIGRIIHKG